MVNRARLQTLVDTAKSGKYRQTQGQLREDIDGEPCFCFEGLACELSGVGEWVQRNIEGELYWQYRADGGAEGCFWPQEVRAYYGLLVVENVNAGGVIASIPTLNDSYNRTFSEIAEGLEAKYLRGEHATG